MKRLIELSRRVLQIHSEGPAGNEELTNFLGHYLQASGLNFKTQHVMHSLEGISKRQFNLIGILGDPLVDRKIRKGLLLISHLDTVIPARKDSWERDAYSGALEGGKIFGLGASDGKLDFICKLMALQKFRETKLKMPIYLVGTCGEEFGMFGARYLIQSAQLNPKYTIIGKPTELKMITAHKGSAILKLQLGYSVVERGARGYNRRIRILSMGRAGHPSYTEQTQNALTGISHFINSAIQNGFDLKISSLSGGRGFNQIPDEAIAECFLTSHQLEDFKRFYVEMRDAGKLLCHFELQMGGLGDTGISFLPDAFFECLLRVQESFGQFFEGISGNLNELYTPPYSTLNWTFLLQRQGGHTAYFDLRSMPDQSIEQIHKQLQDHVATVATQYNGLNLSLAIERMNPPHQCSENSPWIGLCGEAMEEAGLMPNLDVHSMSSEAGHFSKAGYETVVFGPGSPKNFIHGPNEFVATEDLERATLFYEKLIQKVCT